jgi:hypothetical protein
MEVVASRLYPATLLARLLTGKLEGRRQDSRAFPQRPISIETFAAQAYGVIATMPLCRRATDPTERTAWPIGIREHPDTNPVREKTDGQ